MGKVVHSEPTSFDVRQFLSFKFSAFQAQVVSDVSHKLKVCNLEMAQIFVGTARILLNRQPEEFCQNKKIHTK